MRPPSHLVARALAALLAVAATAAATPAAPALAQSPPANDANPVLAYYYAWWDPDTFNRTLFQPASPYNSDDPTVMQRHISQAQAAGIDGFIVSWLGNANRTDTNFARLLDLGAAANFRATIQFETPQFWGVDDVVAQLQAFYQQRINHPALVRYQGRPVIFFWRVATFDNATWSAIRGQVDPGHTAVWIADGDDFSTLSGDAWDGASPYTIAWSADPAGQLPSWAARVRDVAPDKLWIPPVSPGCNDSAARPATCIQDRAGGAFYQAAWDGALASSPSWAVIVSTFNEWMEATEIEPSVQYGDQYLQLTRQNADAFRGLAAAP